MRLLISKMIDDLIEEYRAELAFPSLNNTPEHAGYVQALIDGIEDLERVLKEAG